MFPWVFKDFRDLSRQERVFAPRLEKVYSSTLVEPPCLQTRTPAILIRDALPATFSGRGPCFSIVSRVPKDRSHVDSGVGPSPFHPSRSG
jgi:hypothetical protein